MNKQVIEIQRLSKLYRLGAIGATTLRESLEQWWMHQVRGGKQESGNGNGMINPATRGPLPNSFWALRDIDLNIEQGEIVGLIGRNGAGKSTLLKLLSRITEPTKGRIILRGRVGSLLEVGTGFHPELSGRENIFLNGAILGMKKSEIARKFDEIVAFAEVEQFIDTPVKRYSSGMYVRLAFAVAAHLEPEILIIDEVLAVGDSQFQKKCLGKMEDVAGSGHTVIFVSHNMATIRQLCTRGVLLKDGRIVCTGETEEVIASYLHSNDNIWVPGSVNTHGMELADIYIEGGADGTRTDQPVFNRDYKLLVKINAHQPLPQAALVVEIRDPIGSLVSSLCSVEEGINPVTLEGTVEFSFQIPRLPLLPNHYQASVFVYRWDEPDAFLQAEEALSFQVQPAMVQNAMWSYRKDHGAVRLCETGSIRKL